MADDPDSDLKAGIQASPDGNPLVVGLLSAVLSAIIAYLMLWAASFVGLVEFTTGRWVLLVVVLMASSYIVSQSQ